MSENRKTLKNYDPFKKMKNKAFDESETTMIAIAKLLISRFSKKEVENHNLAKIYFLQMLKVCSLNYYFMLIYDYFVFNLKL